MLSKGKNTNVDMSKETKIPNRRLSSLNRRVSKEACSQKRLVATRWRRVWKNRIQCLNFILAGLEKYSRFVGEGLLFLDMLL